MSIRFSLDKEVSSPDCAWKVVSDVQSMPKYWKGHREVKILNSDANRFRISITFAFPGPGNTGEAEVVVLETERRIVINYVKGPVKGNVTIGVRYEDSKVETSWDVQVPLYLAPVEPWLKDHFIKGASDALSRIAEECSAAR